MKKRIILMTFSFFLLIFFACDIQFPSSVQVKGTPEIRFSANLDIGELLSEVFTDNFSDNSDNGMQIILCDNTVNHTFLIHMDLFDEDLPMDDRYGADSEIWNHLDNIEIPNDLTLINTGDEIQLPLSSFQDFKDFDFKGYKTILYFSGTSIVSKLAIKITVNGSDNTTENIAGSGASGWASWGGSYHGTEPPSGGIPVDIPFDGNDVEIGFQVFIPKGTQLVQDDFEDASIKVEVVVWLPLEFEAGADGAAIELPKNFLPIDGDLFRRSEFGSESFLSEMLTSLALEIGFNVNPFKGGDLYVINTPDIGDSLTIITPLDDDKFIFEVTEDDMEVINNSWPFSPRFEIRFSPGDPIEIPREFRASEFAFKAGLNFTFPREEN